MEQEKNGLYKWGRIALILLVVFLGAQTLGVLRGLSNTDPAYNSLSVTGEGEVIAIPDVASFYFTVSADAISVAAAQTQVTTKMDAILAELKAQGIEDKDIKTTDYNVYPRYRYAPTTTSMPCSPTYCPPTGGGSQILDGYTASHNVTVKVRNTDNAGKVLEIAGSKGATNISGITFTQDDPDATIQAAREEAIKDARDKAKTLAKNLGVKLVRVVSYYDNQGGYPMPYAGGVAYEAQARDLKASNIAPTIPQGENKTKVSVTVVYEIR